ncbi:hypothetical protein DPX16_9398 [Anabarilius grahami]|uniref:Uncharacterized protein n=1 Tax=Anabarilius grahami TaxID=495550 RepID=A0A3N0Y6M0_ANAGA|nr:hypothetical protein DPX16_9398 [Anabarilius grahami]
MVVCLFTVLSVDEKGWSGEILPGNVKLEVGEARLGVPAEIWLPKSLESRCSVRDSCGLPPLMLMLCQGTCAKESGHICMFSQCELQLHRTDSNNQAFLWLTFRRRIILCGDKNSWLCVWESSWRIFALLQVSPVQTPQAGTEQWLGNGTLALLQTFPPASQIPAMTVVCINALIHE